jgi:hypothetical protein
MFDTDRYKELQANNEPLGHVREGLEHLRLARECFKKAGSVRTLARVRMALTSARGAARHADRWPFRVMRREGTMT